jgi:hypothetical protein
MSTDHYDLFVAECDKTFRDYSIQNSVFARDQDAGPDRRIVQILCDEEDALKLLGAAFHVYPEMTSVINAAIDCALNSVP